MALAKLMAEKGSITMVTKRYKRYSDMDKNLLA